MPVGQPLGNAASGRKGWGWMRVLALAALGLLRADSDQWLPSFQPVWTPYVTEVGHEGRFVLQDGTRVDLNTGSRIGVRFTTRERVILLTRVRPCLRS
jgi:ferric-dicitrate binding protein FerR (iron transport regulator)